MKEKYTFEFWRYNFATDNFKSKHAAIIKETICSSRMGRAIVFDSFGHISYNEWDEANQYPTVEGVEEFNRNKVNCLIFNIKKEELTLDPGVGCPYDKLFVYYTANIHEPNYGYVLYSTETGKMIHKYFVDFDEGVLMTSIARTFNGLNLTKVYADAMTYKKNKRKSIWSGPRADIAYQKMQKERYAALGLNINTKWMDEPGWMCA